MRCLKNDYGFRQNKEGDSSFIDSRLKEIEQRAYSIFSYYYKQQVLEQEEMRKRAFFLSKEQIEQKLHNLSLEYLYGLLAARLLAITPSEIVREFFEERALSLDKRLEILQESSSSNQ